MITLTTNYMLHEKLILKVITTGKSVKPIYYNLLSYYFGSTFDRSQEMMEIEHGCVYKRSSKPVMKGSRVETIEQARKEYK